MKQIYEWSVYYIGAQVERTGTTDDLDTAKVRAVQCVRGTGLAGAIVTIKRERGATLYLTTKLRTSGLKWERRP